MPRLSRGGEQAGVRGSDEEDLREMLGEASFDEINQRYLSRIGQDSLQGFTRQKCAG